jgi:hypothetical protein
MSSANSLPKPVILSATSFIKYRKSNVPKTDPWGTSAFNSPVLDLTNIAFADISKAFDTVWIKALILKLEKYGTKGNLLFWLKGYLSRRNILILVEKKKCDSEVLSYNLMLNSGKNKQNKYSNSCVVRKKNSERN